MVLKTLLIDDLRNIAADRVCRTYQEGIDALNEGGWSTLYLDHDLASYDNDGVEKTGYDIMCYIEANQHLKPGQILIVSSNPVGRDRMQKIIDKIYADSTEVS